MKKFLKKLLHPDEYYKELNGYYDLPDELREKLEYHDKYFDGYEDFDKFFSWKEFNSILSVVHGLFIFNIGNSEIFIMNDGKEYVYWLEQFGKKIEEKVSGNAFELLESIYIEGKLMSKLWGSFD